MIIIGSTALKYHAIPFREPKDVDVVVKEGSPLQPGQDMIVVSDSIYKLIKGTAEGDYASPDCIYTLKCSHLMFDNKWTKTKSDIIYLKAIGCKVIEPLYKELVDYWLNVNPPKFNLSLNKTKEEFFTDNVEYVVDHDYLHELVAFPEEPMYKRLLKDGHEVLLCQDKFNTLDFHDQLRLFREEITTIAIERWLLNPKISDVSWYKAYKLALKKTIISLTKNWARDFIIFNVRELSTPDYEYFKHTLETLKGKLI